MAFSSSTVPLSNTGTHLLASSDIMVKNRNSLALQKCLFLFRGIVLYFPIDWQEARIELDCTPLPASNTRSLTCAWHSIIPYRILVSMDISSPLVVTVAPRDAAAAVRTLDWKPWRGPRRRVERQIAVASGPDCVDI